MALKLTPLNRKLTIVKKKSAPRTVAELKKKYDDLPLDFLFGIPQEIDYQCPTLDEQLHAVERAQETLLQIRRCRSLDSAKVKAARVQHLLDPVPMGIDKIDRENFEKLRATAIAWKQLAIRAINETKNPEKFLKA